MALTKSEVDDVLSAVGFEIVLHGAIERVIAKLMAQHIEDPSAFAIRVFVKFTGIFEIVPDNWFVPERIAPKPFARGLPAFVVA